MKKSFVGRLFIISIFVLVLAPVIGQETQVLVVGPSLKSSIMDQKQGGREVKDLFDSGDILAIYEDGSVLVEDTEETRKIIKEKELSVDFSLTSPDRYEKPLNNDDFVKAFAATSKLISKFEAQTPGGEGFYIVQFQGPIKQEWVDELEASGASILFPVPPYAYLVWGQGLEGSFSGQKEVRGIGTLNAVRKMSGGLLYQMGRLEQEGSEIFKARELTLNVLLADVYPNQAENARNKLLTIPGVNEVKFYNSVLGQHAIWEIETLAENIPAIANQAEVFYIESLDKAKWCGERENILDTAQFDASGDGPLPSGSYERWLADKKVNGAGVVVQCVDTGLDRGNATNLPGTVHTDILGRVAGVSDYSGDNDGIDKNGHGTLNAGIISGNPFTRLTDPDGYLVSMGVSPKARIFATKVSNSTSFTFTETHKNMVQEARSFGASVSLQPWGRGTRTFNPNTGEFSDPPAYSTDAAEFDGLTRVANGDNFNPQSMLFVFSAGNFGWFCDMFGCMMVEKSISNPGLAKNVISVGAFTGSPPEGGKRRDPVQNTSRGPTQDGRIAPTLVAPGMGITGMASQSEGYQNGSPVFYPAGQTLYTRGNGSSHAAAQVAGGAALFTDWWQRFNNYSSTPSPAMIKAALINSAEDEQGGSYPVFIPDGMMGEGAPEYDTVDFAPDPNQGWGGLNLDTLIPDPGGENKYIFFDQDTKTFNAVAQEWEETIYAIDQDTPLYITLAWTDPAAAPAASKALVNDLDLIVTNGADQIIYGNAFRKGWSGAGGSPDRVNNVEVVKIEHPYGAYKMKVKAITLAGKILPSDSTNKQDFALAIRGATLASPKGVVTFTAPYYMCNITAGVVLADLDLLGAGTKQLTVNNQTTAGSLVVTLTENPPSSGVFKGPFDLVTSPQGGKLTANHGNILGVSYNDADDGTGSPASVSATAELDCTEPQVTNFVVSDHTAFSLVITFSFNKAVSGIFKYGTDTNPANMTNQIPLEDAALHHTLQIAGLNPCTVYYGKVEIVDHVGNTHTDDNGAAYYSFQTLEDAASFLDDFDAFYNSTNFTNAAIQGVNDWTRIDETANAHSPTHSMRTQAVPSIKDIYLKTKNVTLKPFTRLTFYHKFSLEPGFDGAVVEISTDNGSHWRDLGNHIKEGKYNAMIALFSGNPLMARLAWTYAWDNGQVEFRRSWIDLDKFRNKPVQIRFRLATDDSIILPNSAWYVDDVRISYDSDCVNTLFMRLGRSNYGPDESVAIRVFDPTLPSASSVTVKVSSETEPSGETVTLPKTATNVYEGSIMTKNGGTSTGDSKISCTDGNVITALYRSSDNGGTSNPDKAQAKAFYFLPSLILSPPLNEGVSKIHNDVENALVFPLEMSPRGADIILKSIKFALTPESEIDPVEHFEPDGMKLYLDSNDDKAFTVDEINPSLSDQLLGTASMDPDGSVVFSGLNHTLSRDDTPRFFLLAHITDEVPFGTTFQFEIPNLAADVSAQLEDATPIIAESDRDPRGLYLKIISRAILVNQNAPTIYLEDGETWDTAYHIIGDAVIEANNRAGRSKLPVEVWVARGRYQELLIDPYGKAVKPNVELYGGFGGAESNKEDPRRYIMETFLEYPHRDDAKEYKKEYWYIVDLYGGGVLDGFHLLADYNYNNEYYEDMRPWCGGINCKPSNNRGVKIRNCILRNFRDYAIAASDYGPDQCPNSVVSNCVFSYLRFRPVYQIGSGAMFINCSFYNVSYWDISGKNYFFYNCAWDSSVHKGSKWVSDIHIGGGADEFNRVRNCFFPYGTSASDIYGDTRQNQKISPQFVNPDYLDFRLIPGSPAINAGRSEDNTKPELAEEFPLLDLRGDTRIIGAAPDVGALEMTPGKPMYYVKNVSLGDDLDPQPIIFRPDQPVSLRFTIGSCNMPATLVTLGGRLSIRERYFQLERNIGLFAPVESSSDLEQIRNLPFSLILTGNPPAFYNVKMFLDFLKTDGTNELLDTAFFQFQLPSFVDPVNGDDTHRGGIREPLKTMNKALYYCISQSFDQDSQILVAQGTLGGEENQIWKDNRNWFYWPAIRVEFLGGFNPQTWERDPKAFETIWTGENQRRFMYNSRTFAVKLDGFTFKEGMEQSIEIYHTNYLYKDGYYNYYYFGTNDITNNVFKNNNGNAIMRLNAIAGRCWTWDTSKGYLRQNPIRSSMGAPLTNAGAFNGSALFHGRGSWAVDINNDANVALSDFTLETWVYARNTNYMYYDNLAQSGILFKIKASDNNYLNFVINDQNKLYAQFKNADWDYYGLEVKDTNNLETGKWHHVALTVKKDTADNKKHTATLYLDGAYAAQTIQTKASAFSITPASVYFGPLDGCMDEVRIWNRALGMDEILTNRDKEISTSFGLVCAFHFNEKSGTSTVSSAGNFKSDWCYPWNEEDPAFNISNNLFIDNKAEAIQLWDGIMPTLIHNNVFMNNQNRFLYINHDSPFIQVSNNVVVDNSTPSQASLFWCGNYDQNLWIINNTIASNTAKVFEAERDLWPGDLLHINCAMNNIIWGNTGDTNIRTANVVEIPGRYVYNLIREADAGDPVVDPAWAENFTCVDPDLDSDGYHLLSSSCARGKGPAITLPSSPPLPGAFKDPVIYFSDQDTSVFSFTTDGSTGFVESYDNGDAWGGKMHRIARGVATVKWQIPITENSNYDVQVYIPNGWWYTGDVAYKVTHKTGSSTVNINPELNKIKWMSLGTYNLDTVKDLKVEVSWTNTVNWVSIPFDDLRLIYKPALPAVGTTAPPSAFIAHNFWNLDKDIDEQERPEGVAWDVGADQYAGPGSAVVTARLVSGSTRLAGIPFTVDLKLSRNYDNIPAGFAFRIVYPAGAVTALSAQAGQLGASPTVGSEADAGGGRKYREVSSLPGNTGNTERNPQLVKLTFTVVDPYPESLTIDIIPPASGGAVRTGAGAEIPVTIDDALLTNLSIMAPNPVANFSAVPTRGLVNPDASLFLPVYFQDASLGYVTSWEWDFGDTITSNEQNPMHEYIEPGTYTVTLTVEGPYGKSTKIREDYIVASDPRNPPDANFTGEPYNTSALRVEGPAPLRVEFLDATNGPTSSFLWNFGDTTTSNAQNPTKIYASQGDYTVTLTVDGPMGGDSVTKNNYVHVTAPAEPDADFDIDNPFGYAPHKVNFTNSSSGSQIQFYYYDFGDGNWSQEENPEHMYVLPGSYNSTLTIAGGSGFDVSDPKEVEVKQAFPQKIIADVLLGRKTVTPEEKNSLDFNKDGVLSVADIIAYILSQQ